MKITIWDIFHYIYKWKIEIIAIILFTMLVTMWYVNSHQTYSAETIIRYTDQNARSGFTPNGSPLDVYEIISPNIISGALEDLNIKGSVEEIRSKIVINPIIPNEIVELKKSKNKEGEEYDYFPTDYSVKFTVGSDKSGAYARDILDAIIKNYSIYYSETYLNNAVIPEVDFDTDLENHDYLEVAEVMNSSVTNIIKYLEERHSGNPDFRSPTTGMSLNNLAVEYKAIKNFDLPALFSNIFNAQITKDKEALIKKYKHRQEQYLLTSQHQANSSNVALSLMERFVESNKSVPNSYNRDTDKEFNTNDVFVHSKMRRTKTTYDDLVDKYVLDGVGAAHSLIDSNYCETVIEAFSRPVNENVNYEEAKARAEKSIEYIRNKMSRLYKVTYETIKDYNNLNASRHIESLSGITIKTGLSLRFYLLIAFVIGTMFGILAAITVEVIFELRRKELGEHFN